MTKTLLIGIFLLALTHIGFAQKAPCDIHITHEYIADPQYYFSPLSFGTVKDFKITFIGGNTYRVAVASATEKNIEFSIYDQDNNLLFSNAKFSHAPYWDFEITNTMECTIKISLVTDYVPNDFGAICIGFKQ